jgi:HK97 family phage major capsid protein
MDYEAESINKIASAIEQSNKAFEAFKGRIDQRFEELENKEAKANRPGFGVHKLDTDTTPERKAFRAFMRTGDDAQLKSMSAGSMPDGGYAVPKVISDSIEDLVVNISPIRQIASVQQISTSDFHKLVNLRGTASGWVAETAARPATNTPQLADVKPPMGEIYAFPMASQQMLDDVYFNADTWLAEQVSTEFARSEGAAFVSGDGTNQPAGFLNGTPVATADGVRAFGTLQYLPTGVSGAWPASNPADLLLALVFSLKAQFRQNARWVMSKATLSQIAQFKDSSGRYILSPMTAPGVPATIFGYPVVEAEDMPSVSAGSLSIAFGDFGRGYLIVDRIGTRVIRDPFTNRPYVGFYATKRVGGAVVNSEAIKLIKFAVS